MRRLRFVLIPLALLLATCAADSPVAPKPELCPRERWSLFGSMAVTDGAGNPAHDAYYYLRCMCRSGHCGEP